MRILSNKPIVKNNGLFYFHEVIGIIKRKKILINLKCAGSKSKYELNNMMIENKELTRITLAITFIATYLTVLIGFYDKIKPISFENFKIVNDILYGFVHIYGIAVVTLFSLYLIFTALALDFNNEKLSILYHEVSVKKIEDIRKWLFNWGVNLIFASTYYPVVYFFFILNYIYSFWIAILIWFLVLVLLEILITILLKDEKNSHPNK